MVEPIEPTPPPPAPDVPPENAFDIQSWMEQVVKTVRDQGGIAIDVDTNVDDKLDAFIKLIALILHGAGGFAGGIIAKMLMVVLPILEGLLSGVGLVIQPGMDTLGRLTELYVKQFVTQQTEIRRGEAAAHPDGLRPAAAGLFDSILAPLAGLYGARNPAQTGAGEVNAQFAMGSIVSLHLSTWMLNILSNVLGWGVLKWINSFDDVITASLNSRALGRVAMKPYLMKFMANPLERDLNVKLPLNVGSASNLLKGYLRGAVSREELIRKMRGLGYAEEVVEDLLLDTAKLLSVEAVVWLVNQGTWTEDQATEHLKQAGWPAELAPVVFQLERTSLVRSQMRTLANSLVAAFIDRRIDNPTLRYLLGRMDLTEAEVSAFVVRGAILQELPQRLSFAQMKSLYQESLVDLSYVEGFLREEGYDEMDTDLLVLLEFTRKEEREARIAYQLEQRRIREEARLEREQAALAAQQAELLTLA